MKPDFIRISQDLLFAARVNENTTSLSDTLSIADVQELVVQLNSDEKKKSFFLNLYNAYIIILLKKDARLYNHRNRFFSDKLIMLANHKISLDNIEHSFLRKSEWKFGAGYIKRWFPSEFEKVLRVDKLDYRIHFGLNCGANSCPAIAYYEPENIDEQLELAENVFMQDECKIVEANNVIISSIFKWFKGDFNGKKGIIKLLKKHSIIGQEKKHIKISYSKYDWNMNLEKFRG